MKIVLILIFSLFFFSLQGQEKEVSMDISAIVFLDSFVVTASKKGFDVADFIDIIQKDESFFQAFHNLRFKEYYSNNRIEVYNRKQEIKTAYTNRVQQEIEGNCRTMQTLEEKVEGNFFKNKKKRKYRYYTAKMHDQVFLTHGTVCGEPDQPSISKDNLSGIDKHVNELKKLIFQPGKEVEVPIIGGKTAIFKEDMLQYYDFSIYSKPYLDEKDCYVFRAVAKQNKNSSKTIIKYLETYLDKNSFQIVARNYHLKYNGLFSFDVKMKVELNQIEGKYLPTFIEYNGAWKIPMQKRERVMFKVDFEY